MRSLGATHSQRRIRIALSPSFGCVFGEDPPHSAIGDIIGTSAMVTGEVVDKRDGGILEILMVELDAAPVDLQSSRQNQRSLTRTQGDVLELSYSEGSYEVGRTYAFFITDTPEDTLAIYGHDVDNDQPADEFGDDEGWAGQSPKQVLDCLVQAQDNSGPVPRLDAAVQAAIESNQDPQGLMSAPLTACEYPDSKQEQQTTTSDSPPPPP